MKKYILSLDQGTSSSRAILFNKKGETVAISQKEITQYYPQNGWVEQDPMEIWESQLLVANDVIKKANISATEIHAIGITNQRETSVIWDKKTGTPIYNAIVWQDKRTSNLCENLRVGKFSSYITENTGLVIDSYFSATKIKWILANIKNARTQAENGDLLFGTIDSWLIWNLTKGKKHVSDFTNASRTMLFNINTLKWDEKILEELNIPACIFPEVIESSVKFAETNIFGETPIPLAGIAGDQQSALFGQACFEPGIAKNTYGTGCFILAHTGQQKVKSENGLLTTLTCDTMVNTPQYALEGAVFIAGAAIKWLRDSLKIITTATETEEIANSLNTTDNVYVVPAFTGLGAPYWNQNAKGAILGLSLGSNKEQVIKATLESIAYQSKDVIDAMQKDARIEINQLKVDGGASANNFLMQFQADIIQAEVQRPQNIETTALGAAFLAGLSTGFWKDKNELKTICTLEKTFSPNMDLSQVNRLYNGWKKAIKSVLAWCED